MKIASIVVLMIFATSFSEMLIASRTYRANVPDIARRNDAIGWRRALISQENAKVRVGRHRGGLGKQSESYADIVIFGCHKLLKRSCSSEIYSDETDSASCVGKRDLD